MDNKTMANLTVHPSPESAVWFLGIVVLLLVSCLICNTTILVVFVAEKSFRNRANMLVGSLACSDLVVGMVSIPLWIANSTTEVDLHYYHYSVDILCCSASIFNCALLSMERALKITLPYWYANNVNSVRIKIAILVSWIGAVFVGGLSLARGTDRNNIPYIIFLSVIIYILPVIVMFASNISIFIVAYKHAKSIRKQKCRLTCKATRMKVSESKTSLRLSVISIAYVICWTPVFVKVWGKILLPDGTPSYFNVTAVTLTHVNAVVNPFLYALLNPLFRKAIGKLYRKSKGFDRKRESKRRNDVSAVHTNHKNGNVTRKATHCSPKTNRQKSPCIHSDLWKDRNDVSAVHTNHKNGNVACEATHCSPKRNRPTSPCIHSDLWKDRLDAKNMIINSDNKNSYGLCETNLYAADYRTTTV
ncbi:5-hydroxytryptamine receptor-like [Dendronephthya gigantea]|uniref:5-hydroxytryptamine receptor-like n=1 Tax=Dendronephthya gigantea TaxID=151771 RepID=UPI00106978D4|nr:5-hydroxytryptamine receptor-like [Dendronephthya gigantea]